MFEENEYESIKVEMMKSPLFSAERFLEEYENLNKEPPLENQYDNKQLKNESEKE